MKVDRPQLRTSQSTLLGLMCSDEGHLRQIYLPWLVGGMTFDILTLSAYRNSIDH